MADRPTAQNHLQPRQHLQQHNQQQSQQPQQPQHPPAGLPGIPRSSRAGNGMAVAGVRRNLFQSSLTRRQNTTASTSSISSGVGSGSGASASEGSRLDSINNGTESDASCSDIVVRDRNGDVDFGDPPTPPLDDSDEMLLDARQESEKERQRLAEAVKQYQINQNSSSQPEELLESVRAAMRTKVAALAEDNWMYEPEDMPRHQ